jgi:diamine N-acetyltransferase
VAFELSFQRIEFDCPTKHIEALSEMARFTFSETFRHYEQSDLEDYLGKSLSVEALGEELRDQRNYFYFVILNGVEVGFLKWIFPSTKYLEHVHLDYNSPLLIERFYFLPDYCGRGLASIALEFVASFAKYEVKADGMYLSVWEKNFRAQSFYQKHGFRTVGSFDYPVGKVIDVEFLYAKPLHTKPMRSSSCPN